MTIIVRDVLAIILISILYCAFIMVSQGRAQFGSNMIGLNQFSIPNVYQGKYTSFHKESSSVRNC